MDIKEEDPFSEHVASLSEIEFFTNSDAVLLDDDCEVASKAEVKSEAPFPDFCSQNERNFLLEDHEMDNKIEIKEEPWWLETQSSSVCNDINVRGFAPVKLSRLHTKTRSGDCCGKTPFLSTEVSGRETSFNKGKDQPEYASKESHIPEISTGEKPSDSKQSSKCSEKGETCYRTLYLNINNVEQEAKKLHECAICFKSFTYLSALKTHNLIHEGKKPHHCRTCNKSFILLSHLKRHNLIHEGKKPHHCKICNKSFTELSSLKRHNLIHEAKKPHHCQTCDTSFTQLSSLKRHNLIHEGKKPHQCKTCDKSFTDLSNLKTHNLIHEGKKPHHCKTCDRSFTRFSNLKRHNLIH